MPRRTQTCTDRMSELDVLVERLMRMAQGADAGCERNDCLTVFGVVRDSMWKIQTAVAAWDRRLEVVPNTTPRGLGPSPQAPSRCCGAPVRSTTSGRGPPEAASGLPPDRRLKHSRNTTRANMRKENRGKRG